MTTKPFDGFIVMMGPTHILPAPILSSRSVNSIPDLVKALEELLRVIAEETCTQKSLEKR